MIFLNPRGGLCNRLRVIGSAIKLGVAYDDFIIVFWRILDVKIKSDLISFAHERFS